MHPTRSRKSHQQRCVHHRAVSSDSYDFFNILTGPELLDQVEILLPDHRERLFPPTETLSMFLAQAPEHRPFLSASSQLMPPLNVWLAV